MVTGPRHWSWLGAALLVGCGLRGFGQAPAGPGWTGTCAFDELAAATALGGGQGPEDIAYHPQRGTLFVLHDVPSVTPDILLEYTLDGRLLGGSVLAPGIGGLCAFPNGNLLVSYGNVVREVLPSGAPVPGGINVAVAGYGGIQDLDFDPAGTLWIHDGNSGDFSTLDPATGLRTPRFLLTTQLTPTSPSAITGAQGFTFDDAGNLVAAVAFFQNGGLANGTLLTISPAGTVLTQGASASQARLVKNEDPCALAPGAFTIVNGMTWIGPRKELAISSFFGVQGANIARFARAGTAFVGLIGSDSVRSDTLVFAARTSGDAVIGTSGFTLGMTGGYVGDTLYLAVSTARLCANPLVGSGTLYVDLGPATLVLLLPIPLNTSDYSLALDLNGIPPSAAGAELFAQFGGLDLGLSTVPALLTRAFRVRLDLN